MINEAHLNILLPNAAPFQFDVQYTTFSVLSGNQLSKIELFGLYTSVPDAVALTKQICQAWGISTDGLDQVANDIASGPMWTSQGWGKIIYPPNISNGA